MIKFFFIKKKAFFFLHLFLLLLFFNVFSPFQSLCAPKHQTSANQQIIILDKTQWWLRGGFDEKWLQDENSEIANKKKWRLMPGLPIHPGNEFPERKDRAMHYSIQTNFMAPETWLSSPKPFAVLLPYIGQNWQVYLNGHLLKSEVFLDQQGNILTIRSVRDALVGFSSHILQPENTLLLHIIGDPDNFFTGLFFSVGYRLGEYSDLETQISEKIPLFLIFLYFFIGLYHILLFSKRPQDRYNLFFALFVIACSVYFLTRSNTIFSLIKDTGIITRIELFVLFFLVPLLFWLIEELFFRKISRITKYYFYYSIFLSFSILVSPLNFLDYILRVWQVTVLPMLPFIIYIFHKGLKLGKPEAKPLLAGIGVLIFTAIFDILDNIFWQTGWAFSKYGFFILVMGIAVILANRFLRLHTKIEDLNSNLEKKVADRTLALEQTLSRVQHLKNQQDGDYFLTSLLIKPLNSIRNIHLPVIIRSYEKQKKQFQFKNKQVEIGGDINIANSLILRSRHYTVFLNGDAMGKSIQGAGGALVLGVVFNSYISRTNVSSIYNQRFPEHWLKDCFLDLQSIFEAFDGSMLASLVMGLIDNATGTMYYLNAEHPWTVLYRDGIARFIEDSLDMRKIGISIYKPEFRIRVFQLEPDDVLIMGSDGRDDIAIGNISNGVRKINEDEKLFLEHVQQSQADLDGIVKRIQEYGELTDDFTLLHIRFLSDAYSWQKKDISSLAPEMLLKYQDGLSAKEKKDFIQAESLLIDVKKDNELHPLAMIALMDIYEEIGNFIKLSNMGMTYLDNFPAEDPILQKTSWALYMDKNYDLAVHYAERYKSRHPQDCENLILLANSYNSLGNNVRANKLLQKILQIQPENQSAAILLSQIGV